MTAFSSLAKPASYLPVQIIINANNYYCKTYTKFTRNQIMLSISSAVLTIVKISATGGSEKQKRGHTTQCSS